MKTNIIKIGLGAVISFLLIPHIYGQLPKRVVSYTTLTQEYFSIPTNTDVKSINELDYNKMISEDKTISTEISIDRSNTPTITTIHHNTPRYFNDYENEVAKSVSNNIETILYDQHNTEILRTPHSREDMPKITLQDEEVNQYGIFNQVFRSAPEQFVEYLSHNGFTVRILRSPYSLIAISDDIEIFINYTDYIYEIRYFENRDFIHSITNHYQNLNGTLIPYSTVTNLKSSLEGEIPMLTTTIISYLSYRIVNEKGKEIVNFISKEDIMPKKGIQIGSFEEISKRDVELQIFPNPSSDQVTILVPFFMKDGWNIEIINTAGISIFKTELTTDLQYTIDISSFKNGIYLVRCIGNGEQVTAKLVKQ